MIDTLSHIVKLFIDRYMEDNLFSLIWYYPWNVMDGAILSRDRKVITNSGWKIYGDKIRL